MTPQKLRRGGYKHHLPPTTGPLAEFYKLWSRSLERREIAESARKTYVARVHRYYSLSIGPFSLVDVMATRADDLVVGFAKLDLSTPSKTAYWSALKLFFAFSVERGLISGSPLEAFRKPDPRKRKKSGSADLEALLDEWWWSQRPKPAPNVWKVHRAEVLRLLEVASLPFEKVSVSKLTLVHVRDRFASKWPSTQGRRRVLFVTYERFFDFLWSSGTIEANPLQGRWHLFRSRDEERSLGKKRLSSQKMTSKQSSRHFGRATTQSGSRFRIWRWWAFSICNV